MSVDAQTLYDVVEATWPPASTREVGPFTVREGAGGGKRVSAATARQTVTVDDLPQAEAAMLALGQTPLFMIRQGDEALDALLDSLGYSVIDPVNMYSAPVSLFSGFDIPRVATFVIWEPLAIMLDIWTAGGIGPGRINVMKRAPGPKTGILGRQNDSPAATGFVAMHDRIAMIHALEVLPHQRRAGMGRYMMFEAARWAVDNGADQIAVICTKANKGANGLYASLGMTLVGEYHYRQKDTETA